MKWALEFSRDFERGLKRLDAETRRQVVKKVRTLQFLDDPSVRCLPYTANLAGLWKLRVGNYRVILDIRAGELIILALDVEHRSKVYKHRR